MDPSLRVSLKGLNRTRDTRDFILVRPLTVKVKAYVQFEVVLIRVSMTRELNCYASLSTRSFLPLNRRRVVPLYREVDAQRLSESRPAYNSIRPGLLTTLALHYKSCHNGGLSLRALSRLRVLSPLLIHHPQAWYWASRDDHYDVTRPLLGG